MPKSLRFVIIFTAIYFILYILFIFMDLTAHGPLWTEEPIAPIEPSQFNIIVLRITDIMLNIFHWPVELMKTHITPHAGNIFYVIVSGLIYGSLFSLIKYILLKKSNQAME